MGHRVVVQVEEDQELVEEAGQAEVEEAGPTEKKKSRPKHLPMGKRRQEWPSCCLQC